jgi:hypothetical protein
MTMTREMLVLLKIAASISPLCAGFCIAAWAAQTNRRQASAGLWRFLAKVSAAAGVAVLLAAGVLALFNIGG